MSNNSGYKTYYHIHDTKNGGYKTYYHGIDVTGLDYDIVSRMYVSDNDFCTSKIFDTIVRLNRCKQENPKTAKLVDDLIKELVSILDLHVEEEKKKKSSLDKQIAELKEENEKLRKIIEYLQEKKKNVVYTHKGCSTCKYISLSRDFFPCHQCNLSTHNRWQPNAIIRQQLENLMNNTPEPNMGIHKY